MNDLIKRAMGAPTRSPLSFMALLASVGDVPGMDTHPELANRVFFKDARARLDVFAAERRSAGYSFFDLMEEQGFMPGATELADWMNDAAEQTIAHVLDRPANDNGRRPRLVPPRAA